MRSITTYVEARAPGFMRKRHSDDANHTMWTARGEDRRKATRRERHDALMEEADLAFERGDMNGAEELKAAAKRALEGEERRSGRDRRK